MPRKDKEKVEKSRAGEGRARRAPRRSRAWKWTPYMIGSVVVAAVVALVGIAYYQQYVAPFQRVIIDVDGTQIRMREFLDRARMSGSSGLSTLQNLTNEQLIRSGAAGFGIFVTREDVDRELRKEAAGSDNATVSEAEFREWYRQTLNDNKLSDAKYREIVTNRLLSAALQIHISRQIPSSLEHAHVYSIFVSSYEEAAEVKARVESGEDFRDVAREVSIDQATREKAGELDWVPQGVLVNNNMDPFSLAVGQVSDPLAIVEDPSTPPSAYYVIMVAATEVREVQPQYLPEVQTRRFQQWLADETKQHKIKWTYNSEIDAWVNWQLRKTQSSSG